jgi:hypothetical protein
MLEIEVPAHGTNSSTRLTGYSAIRPSTSLSQACGSTPLSLAVSISVSAIAAALPPPSEPANSQFFRPSALTVDFC